ncbi:MAG TPA: formylglycine-generating enzyme family protein [Rhizobiales bacterium]|nr:formylglycine-generating enzyme family protein [Hyphomicrobiales bacterium]
MHDFSLSKTNSPERVLHFAQFARNTVPAKSQKCDHFRKGALDLLIYPYRALGFTAAILLVTTGQAQAFDLVSIPAGVAVLGDANGDANEVVKTVRMPAFKLMRNEVTNQQFARFVAATKYQTTVEKTRQGYVWSRKWQHIKGADWRHPQGPQSNIAGLENHPVVQVSGIDALAFCRFYGMRLPSQDEWEYAARGSTSRRFPWGNNYTPASLTRRANAGTIACCAASDRDGFLRTAPVGSYPLGRSPFGLDDMAGNVWEWTSSRFPGAPGKQIIRGGGWGNNPYCLRTAYRHGNPPDIGLDMVGIRCAAD